MVFHTGQILKNRSYRVENNGLEGGFGITYRATDLDLEFPVIIKVPNVRKRNQPGYEEAVAAFKREGRFLAKLQTVTPHPHIVRVIGFFEEAWEEEENGEKKTLKVPCLVMEYIPGENLYKIVRNSGQLSEEKAISYIKQIGSALEVCHQAGVIHRDAHPGNMLLRNNSDTVVLIDFGLAGNVGTEYIKEAANQHFAPWEQVLPLEVWGTFLPPQELKQFGKEATIKKLKKSPTIDIYTLAATLYYLVTGHPPDASCLGRKLYKENSVLSPPQDYNPNLSTYVCDAILRGMEIDPANRPQSVQEWLDLLTLPRNPVFRFEVVTVNRRGEITHREMKEVEYYTEILPGGVALEMVAIPGGTFIMGTDEEEIARLCKKYDWDWFQRESPQHSVTISPFYMGKYPITQEQWQAVASLPKIERDLKPDPSRFKGNNRPVEKVSWYDAVEFCARLSKATGKGYRLPSESQWEYACRAIPSPPIPLPQGEGRIYPPFHFGETLTDSLANYRASSTYADEKQGKYREQTIPVGSFSPNAFGLYDMHGNVWEWCLDPWHDNYEGAPDNGEVWQENGNDNRSSLRGGSWLDFPYSCRSAVRRNYHFGRAFDNNSLGFRVLCVAPRTF